MKKFLAGLFAFVNLVLFPIVLLSTITVYWVFTPGAIKKVIHASEIGEQLPSLIVAMAADQQNNDETIDIDAAATFVGETFSADDVYAITDSLVDGVGAWFTTDKPLEQLDLTIDISNLKAKLIPAITEQINASAVEGMDTVAMADEVTKNIPDTVNVQDLLQQQLVQGGSGDQLALINEQVDLLRTYWGALHWIVWIGWLVLGLNYLWIILLRLRPAYAPFGWLAWMELLKLLEVIPLVLAAWLAPQFILPFISGSFDNAIVTVINKAVSALMNTYLWPLVIMMAVMFLLTIFWFVLRAIVKHHGTQKNRPVQPITPAPTPTPKAQQPKTEKSEL